MSKKGFTLIELMIVVAIIAIIAAIAIPNLLRSRLQSNESSAIGNLRTVCSAEIAYNSANNTYATSFDELTGTTPPFLDGDWAGVKQGYTFGIAAADDNTFSATGEPSLRGTTGNKGFFVDASGVIRFEASAAGTATSDPIGTVAGAAAT